MSKRLVTTHTAEISLNFAENQFGFVALFNEKGECSRSLVPSDYVPDCQIKVDVDALVRRIHLQCIRRHGHAVQVDVRWSDPLFRICSISKYQNRHSREDVPSTR